jgi:glycosyltransferase involved in cell wall biosynthesis
VDRRFRPGGRKSPEPLVVAVGRLVPVKRLGLLIDALVEVRREHPGLRAVIAGEGYERQAIAARVAHHDAAAWIDLPGRVDDDALVDLYRRAWVVASASRREGWGMTLTEAAACGTPAVASRIAGHRDAVIDGHSGLLFDDERGLVMHLGDVLRDSALRQRLGQAARVEAAGRTWDAAARSTLAVLAAEAVRRRGSRHSPL